MDADKLLAGTYEAVRHRHDTEAGRRYISDHWRRYVWLLRALPPLRPGARVLEVGASILSSAIKRGFGAEVHVAYHELEPEWAGRFEEEGIRGHAVEILRDRLPLEPGSFDLILLDQVLEHLPVAPHFLLKQLLRALGPKGELLLCVPGFARLENRLALLKGANPQEPMDPDFVYYAHHREPVARECREWVAACGGVVKECLGTEFDPPENPARRALRLARYLRHLDLAKAARLLAPSLRSYIFVRCARAPGRSWTEMELEPPLGRTGEFGVPGRR